MTWRRRRDPAPPAPEERLEPGAYTPRGAPVPRALPPEPASSSPALEMLSRSENEDFANLPFGGHAGEMFVPEPPPLAEPTTTELVIEPPEWDLQVPPLADPPREELDALAALKLADGDVEELPEWRPVEPETVPLEQVRPKIPEVDWRQEGIERANAERHSKLLRQLDEEGT